MELIDRMSRVLRVLAHTHRLQIVEMLDRNGKLPVHEIVERLGIPQATVSHHLNKMTDAGLIKSERRAREVWYTVADPRSLTILDCLRKKGNTS